MQGEKLAAVAFSFGLHACLLAVFAARMVPTQGVTLNRTVTVSFAAPRIEEVSVEQPRVVPPSGDLISQTAVAPPPLQSVSPAPEAAFQPLDANDSPPNARQAPVEQAMAPVRPNIEAKSIEADQAVNPMTIPDVDPHSGASASPPDASAPSPPPQFAADVPSPDAAAPPAKAAPKAAVDDTPSETLLSSAPDLLTEARPTAASPAPPAMASREAVPPGEVGVEAVAMSATAPSAAERAPVSASGPPAALVTPSQAATEPQSLAAVLAPVQPADALKTVPNGPPAAPADEKQTPKLPKPDVRPLTEVVPSLASEAAGAADLPPIGGAEAVPLAAQADTRVIALANPPAPVNQAPSSDLPPEAKLASLEGPVMDERAQRIHEFIERYDGGPCFFAALGAVSDSGADIDSFSVTADPFKTFDSAFKSATGLEARVSGQRVWSAQCPVVEFLRRLPRDGDVMPTLDLDHRDLHSGDILSGTIRGTGHRRLGLFIVSEKGVVDDVSDRLSAQGNVTTFALRASHEGTGGPFPQMLVLVASNVALLPHPTNVEALFKPMLGSQADGFSVAAKLFLMTR